MMNFDTELDVQGVTQLVAIRETVHVRRSPDRSHLLVAPERWSWRELRSYVLVEMERRFGPQDKLPRTRESSVFKSFIDRWGPEMSAAMARYIFEVCDGMWLGQPVTIYRWCKNSDPYFAVPLAERLAQIAEH